MWWAPGNPQTLRSREMKFPGGSMEMNWVIVPGERNRLGVGWGRVRGRKGLIRGPCGEA